MAEESGALLMDALPGCLFRKKICKSTLTEGDLASRPVFGVLLSSGSHVGAHATALGNSVKRMSDG